MAAKSIFKGCKCPYCKGSKQIASKGGHKVAAAKKQAHKKFRKTGKNLTENSVTPSFISTERWG